jgi:hypothetical protein
MKAIILGKPYLLKDGKQDISLNLILFIKKEYKF